MENHIKYSVSLMSETVFSQNPKKVVSKLSFIRFFFAFCGWKISLFKNATHLLYVIFGEAFSIVYRFFKLDFYLKLSEKIT